MKYKIIFIFLLIIPSITYSQDSLKNNHLGLMISYDGYHFNNIGAKYWITDNLCLWSKIGIFIKETRDDQEETIDDKSSGYDISLGSNIVIKSFYDLYPYLFFAFRYLRGNYEYNINFIHKSKDSIYRVETGVGIEIGVLKNFSIAGQHNFYFEYFEEINERDSKRITKDFKVGESNIIFTFYF